MKKAKTQAEREEREMGRNGVFFYSIGHFDVESGNKIFLIHTEKFSSQSFDQCLSFSVSQAAKELIKKKIKLNESIVENKDRFFDDYQIESAKIDLEFGPNFIFSELEDRTIEILCEKFGFEIVKFDISVSFDDDILLLDKNGLNQYPEEDRFNPIVELSGYLKEEFGEIDENARSQKVYSLNLKELARMGRERHEV